MPAQHENAHITRGPTFYIQTLMKEMDVPFLRSALLYHGAIDDAYAKALVPFPLSISESSPVDNQASSKCKPCGSILKQHHK